MVGALALAHSLKCHANLFSQSGLLPTTSTRPGSASRVRKRGRQAFTLIDWSICGGSSLIGSASITSTAD
jgi:hypothetical protein